MRIETKATAINFLEAKGHSKEFLLKEDVDINKLLKKEKANFKLAPELKEPEIYAVIDHTADTMLALLETDLNPNVDFNRLVVDLITKCSKPQLEQMYCNYYNTNVNKPSIKEIKKESVYEKTFQLYINKLKANGIDFTIINDSVCTRNADDNLCEKLLKEAELEATKQ